MQSRIGLTTILFPLTTLSTALLGDANTAIGGHSYVANQNCAGVTYHARLDIPEVLNWIEEVSALD